MRRALRVVVYAGIAYLGFVVALNIMMELPERGSDGPTSGTW